MARQDVQNDTSRMDIVRQCFRTGGLHGLQTIGQDSPKDIHHLPVTAGLAFQLALHAPQCRRQLPILERGSVTKRTGFAC